MFTEARVRLGGARGGGAMTRPVLAAAALLALWHCAATARGARILAIEPQGSKSHWQYMRSILDVLSTRHLVTVITPLPTGARRANYTEIDASAVFPVFPETDVVDLIERFGSAVKMLPLMPDRSHERDICDAFYALPLVRQLLFDGGGDRYDLLLTEPFYSPCLSYVAHRLRVPEIYAIPSAVIAPMEAVMFGVEPNPSYVPNLLYNGGIGSMDGFAQRLVNAALFAYVKFVPWLTDARMAYREPRPYDAPGLRHRPSAVFVNTHFITEPPRPFPVNMVQIGGVHLRPPESLPRDIFDFIENSPHGIIYFTFGSVTSMSTLPKHIQRAFVEAFSEIPQRVLWKYNGEIEDMPDNIMTKNWFPQRDILLHPKVKLFISHGGISGVHEAVDAGVPVLGFPLFYDQPRNVGNLVDAGMALSMDLLTVTKNSFLKTIQELINDKKYADNAKLVSKCFKDRPISSSELIIYWTDYVLRHHGTYHINFESRDLTWYQLMFLDVIVIVIIFLLIVFYTVYFTFKCFVFN